MKIILKILMFGLLFNLPYCLFAQTGDPITIWDTNYGNTGGSGMLYLNQAAPQMVTEGPSVGNPNLFEVPITGGVAGALGARELCDVAFAGASVEGPDFLIQVIIPPEKRISCQDATFTICRRGDFGHTGEKVFVVDEDGIIIGFVDSSGGGGAADCSPAPQCVTATISPCAINSMMADGVVNLGIHTPGGDPGATGNNVDVVCTSFAGARDGDYDNDGTLDGNCVELTAFSFVVEQPDSSFTVDGSASALSDGKIFCPNETIDLAPNQMNGCSQQFSINGTSIPNGNHTFTTAGTFTICNTVGHSICVLEECITVIVQAASIVEAGPDATICAGEEFTLAGASTTPDSAFWSVLFDPENVELSDTLTTDMPETVTFSAEVAGVYTLVLTTIGMCDTIKDTREILVNGIAVQNAILYEATCDAFVTDFTLIDADLLVNPTATGTTTYHPTLSDAIANINSLSSPFNAVDGTVVYAKVADATTGCFAYPTVTLRVVPNNDPTGKDKDQDGISDEADRDDDNDGIPDDKECDFSFDLTERSLLAGTNPVDLEIGDKVLYNNAIILEGVVFDLVGEVTGYSFGNPAGSVSITGLGDPFDLVNPDPTTDDYVTMRLTLVTNGSATAVTPMGTPTSIPFLFISINDIDSGSDDFTDIAGIAFNSGTFNSYLTNPTDLTQGTFINGGGPSGFDTYYLDPTAIGSPTDWVGEGGVSGLSDAANTLNAIKYEFINFTMLELVVGVTGNNGNLTERFSRMNIVTCPDTDGDGIPNNQDLDSDNDGIPDVIEACGNLDLDIIDCMLNTSSYIELTDGGVLNCPAGLYDTGCTICADSDMDGILDYLDPDSDGDGCADSCEAGVSDPDDDGVPGTAPVVVDDCGRVNGMCFIPTDTTWIDTVYQFPLDLVGDCDAMSAQNFPSNVSFQWYFNDSPVVGATNSTYLPSPRTYGDYYLIATKSATCKVTSAIITTCCEPPAPVISGN